MKLSTLDELFLYELKDVYDAEQQLVEALPKLARASTDPDLATAFESHLTETRKQVTRLREVFAECDETPDRVECKGMKGLIAEAEQVMKEDAEPAVMDAALIAAAQRVEHYEIAAYGTLITWAQSGRFRGAQHLLEQNLEEEKAADEKLTEIAEQCVNAAAQGRDEEDSEPRPTVTTVTRSTSRARTAQPARSRRAKK
jgi:ferritin-like metal-binding protein YciE